MKVFMTGATGSIGGEVAAALRKRGHEITGLVTGAKSAEKLKRAGYTSFIGDMREPQGWTTEAAKADALIHVAQVRPGKRLSGAWAQQAAVGHLAATKGLIAAAKQGHCKIVIYTSGIVAQPSKADEWTDESVNATGGAMANYHLAGERLVEDARTQGVPALALRPGMVYGPAGNFAKYFLAEAQAGRFRYVGPGTNYMSFVHVSDLAEAYANAVERPPSVAKIAVVDDEPVRIKDFANALVREFGRKQAAGAPAWLASLFAGKPLVEFLIGSYRAHNNRCQELLKWTPKRRNVIEGLTEVAAKFRGMEIKAAPEVVASAR